eukprot:201332-Rhodomonas_salina.1
MREEDEGGGSAGRVMRHDHDDDEGHCAVGARRACEKNLKIQVARGPLPVHLVHQRVLVTVASA